MKLQLEIENQPEHLWWYCDPCSDLEISQKFRNAQIFWAIFRKLQKFCNFKSKSNPTMRHLIGYVQKMLICHTKLSLFRTLQRVPRGITRFHWIFYRLDIVELIYFVILMFSTSKMVNFNRKSRWSDNFKNIV